MRKIFLNMGISLDGYFEGPNHDISWHNVDDEVFRFELKMLRSADLFIFGRRTYQLMEDAWPRMAKDPALSKENREIAYLLNNTPKIVISRTLKRVAENENWKNVTLIHEFNPDEIRKLKEQQGKDICVGGSELAVSFAKEGLIDDFWFMVNPVILGKGTPILSGLEKKLNLQLVKTKRFKSGNVLLHYRQG